MVEKTEKKSIDKDSKYFEAVGRRKTSVARVRMTPASKNSVTVNDREFVEYFSIPEHRNSIVSPLQEVEGKFNITALLSGGGVSSQADALRHGIARAILELEPGVRTKLKVKGFLKRDPRAKERRKFGLKKARKAPQWSKR
ncbi:30S ribosomal protein S9 [Candidatus Parcubacteria bacterium]|nr:30S ribosomal protein S9 [Candidatus Parcubacteria bacterium]